MRVDAAMPILHERRDTVVGRLPRSGDRKAVERIHGPGALEQTPVLVAGLVAKPRHFLDRKRRCGDEAGRRLAREVTLEANDGLLIMVGRDMRKWAMPEDIGEHCRTSGVRDHGSRSSIYPASREEFGGGRNVETAVPVAALRYSVDRRGGLPM